MSAAPIRRTTVIEPSSARFTGTQCWKIRRETRTIPRPGTAHEPMRIPA